MARIGTKRYTLRSMKKLKNWRLKSNEERRFKMGHPWVYSNELQESPKGIELGELLELHDSGGAFLAYGFGNPHSLIAFRALSRTRSDSEFDLQGYFTSALQTALDFRLQWYRREQSFRMVYGEVDSLPGLVIDRFVAGPKGQVVYILQPHSSGMDRNLEIILSSLKEISTELEDPKSSLVVLRRDAGSREREGLNKEPVEVRNLFTNSIEASTDVLREFKFTVPGAQGDVSLFTDLIGGQKTGFFFDQLQNIKRVEMLALQKLEMRPRTGAKEPYRILDLCSYIGQWSLHLSGAVLPKSAVEATCVDSSESALKFAAKNLATLKKPGVAFEAKTVRGDILEPIGAIKGESYDIVVADPPAFIKSRKSITQGKSAYVSLFATAIERTLPDGLVVCCSCSQLLSNSDMIEVLAKAARRAHRTVRWISQGSPSIDHPAVFDFSEGQYLKCWIGQVS